MARDLIQICNEAISDLPAHPITDLSDGTTEAEECARHLPGVVADLLGEHDFDFARRRAVLAPIANDRPGEWQYAYALPDAEASPVALIWPRYGGSVDVVTTPMVWFSVMAAYQPAMLTDFVIADGKLYTNMIDAVLEYSIEAVEPTKWPALFAQTVIRLLAARIYRPILGEKSDTAEWRIKQQAAQVAMNKAVADDLNRHPRDRRSFVSEAEMARQGYGALPWLR